MKRGFLARARSRLTSLCVLLTRRPGIERAGVPARARERVLYVANAFLPTLQLSFVRPLQALVDSGDVATELLSQEQLRQMWRGWEGGAGARGWVRRRFDQFKPTMLVFCRYSGPHAAEMLSLARSRGIPAIYHIDDDLLHVPREIGEVKYRLHNEPVRLEAVRYLLGNVDLVYCSTPELLRRLQQYGIALDGVAGRAHCAGQIMRGPPAGGPVKIGYMGIDHAHDFEVALPAIVDVMRECPDVVFEIFGPMEVPAALREFKGRVRTIAPLPDYVQFMEAFAALDWAVGICPLAETPFNAMKGNNKWVEYTSVGAAVVASAGLVYDDCCGDDCGILVSGTKEWKAALLQLINEPALRREQVARAQAKLSREFSVESLRTQLLDIFKMARKRAFASGPHTLSGQKELNHGTE